MSGQRGPSSVFLFCLLHLRAHCLKKKHLRGEISPLFPLLCLSVYAWESFCQSHGCVNIILKFSVTFDTLIYSFIPK